MRHSFNCRQCFVPTMHIPYYTLLGDHLYIYIYMYKYICIYVHLSLKRHCLLAAVQTHQTRLPTGASPRGGPSTIISWKSTILSTDWKIQENKCTSFTFEVTCSTNLNNIRAIWHSNSRQKTDFQICVTSDGLGIVSRDAVELELWSVQNRVH